MALDLRLAGGTDCHTHIFGPDARFPPRVASSYALPVSPYAALRSTLNAAGLDRAVIVQPAPYAQDASALLDALAQGCGSLRGVASARPEVTDELLDRYVAQGVVALRFVETKTASGERYAGSVELAACATLATRMAQCGLHAEVWSPLDVLLSQWSALQRTSVKIVLDHMGGFNAALGVDHPDFQNLLALVREGAVSVKLTLCRRAPFGSDFSELRPFHDALVDANPAALIWGSDFPFVRMDQHAPTVDDLLLKFTQWVPDQALQSQILVENPTAIYRFPPVK